MQMFPGRILTAADRSEMSSGYAESLCKQTDSSKQIWDPKDVCEMGERRKRTEYLQLGEEEGGKDS